MFHACIRGATVQLIASFDSAPIFADAINKLMQSFQLICNRLHFGFTRVEFCSFPSETFRGGDFGETVVRSPPKFELRGMGCLYPPIFHKLCTEMEWRVGQS
jgi:hypothetical protein